MLRSMILAIAAAALLAGASESRAQSDRAALMSELRAQQLDSQNRINDIRVELYRSSCDRPEQYLGLMSRLSVREQNVLRATCELERSRPKKK